MNAARERSFRSLAVVPILGLAALFLSGVVGYRFIEGWSTLDALWMVAITLSTIGYGEVHPLTDQGRWFTIMLIGATLLWAGRFAAQLAQLVADGEMWQEWKQARLRQELASMKDHYLVIGRGRLGREIVADLESNGVPVVVVDPHPWDGPECKTVTHVVGDATNDHVLRQAGVERARAIAIATPNDATNIYLVLSVRQLNSGALITVRIEDESAADKARRAGADRVIMPYHLSGSRMSRAMMQPAASAFVDRAEHRKHDDLQFSDVTLTETSPALGSVRNLDLPSRFSLIAVAIVRADEIRPVMPDHETRAHVGDTLIVVGSKADVARFSAWAAPTSRSR